MKANYCIIAVLVDKSGLFSFAEGGDFTTLSIVLTFDPATSRLCKNITITDDNVPENDETFTVILTDSGITLSPDTATVTIVDNDGMCTSRSIAGCDFLLLPSSLLCRFDSFLLQLLSKYQYG